MNLPIAEIPADNQAPCWNWKDVLSTLLGVLLLYATGIIILIVAPRSLKMWQDLWVQNTVLFNIALVTLEFLAICGGIYVLFLRRMHLNSSAIGIRRLSTKWLIAAIFAGIAAIPLTSLVATGVQTLLGKAIENPQVDFLAPQGFSWAGFIGMLLTGGLLVPFAEEVLFRGFLFTWMRQRWSFWPCALITSTLFGVLHGELSISISAFCLGIILAWFFEKSKSLWSSIVIHAINNSVKLVFLYVLLYQGITLPGIT